jgi:FkbM family methyltransferase
MKQIVRGLLNRLGFDVVRYPDPVSPRIDVLDLALKYVASVTPDFFFVQVGANDGVTFDPIRKYILHYHWRGILIEPQPGIFRELTANYDGEPQLAFENAAIATEDGSLTLYTVDDPRWHVLASFDKGQVAGSKFLPEGARIKELTVPALSVATLIARHAISRIDLLQVDVEGFDYDIIQMFLSANLKPIIINFEYTHMNNSRRRECWKYLADRGYGLLNRGTDTLAFLEGGWGPREPKDPGHAGHA